MLCITEVVVKYVLYISNTVFALLGITIIGLSAAAHARVNQIPGVIIVNLSFLTISLILTGCFVFTVSLCAFWGAIKESRLLLMIYAVFMGILAVVKFYFTITIFIFLASAHYTISGWLNFAFSRPAVATEFNLMETLFQCCGTTGASSYNNIGREIPPSCCHNPDVLVTQCTLANSYEGCNTKVTGYFDTFGGAIAAILIVLIIVEVVCMTFGLLLAWRIRNKRFNNI